MGGTVEKTTKQAHTSKNDTEVIWNRLFRNAIKASATDIHLEPHWDNFIVRYRVNGLLSPPIELATATAFELITYLKQLASMLNGLAFTTQVGRFTQPHGPHTYQCTVSTVPVAGQERLVIHLSNPVDEPPSLTELGLWGMGLREFTHALTKPRGFLLISGPRNSGIDMTLASCASAVRNPLHRIVSVEDSTPYRVPDVRYMTVRPQVGLSWHRVLALQLKNEPAVVLLGNAPDRPTAQAALQAAATQQLVICGVRADYSSRAVSQLLLMSAEPQLLGTSLELVTSQRVAPMLCLACRQPARISRDTLHAWLQQLSRGNISSMEVFHSQLEQLKNTIDPAFRTRIVSTEKRGLQLWQAKPGGCSECHMSGYQGTIGLIEVVKVTDKLRAALVNREPLPELAENISAGIVIDLFGDMFLKAASGLISADAIAH